MTDASGTSRENVGPGFPEHDVDWNLITKLLPAIRLCVEQVAAGADWTIGVIVTDGIIEDEKDCIAYCLRAGREMAGGRRKPIKLILIGIGEEVDEAQLERFDDMFENTGIGPNGEG